MPTFQRLKEKHPDAEMKWFARGKLWDSPEAARPPRREYGNRDGRAVRERDARGRGDLPERSRRRSPTQRERTAGASTAAATGGPEASIAIRGRRSRMPRRRGTSGGVKKVRAQAALRGSSRDRGSGPSAPRTERWTSGPPEKPRKNRPPREKPHGDTLRRPATVLSPGQERQADCPPPCPITAKGSSGPPDRKQGARPPRGNRTATSSGA